MRQKRETGDEKVKQKVEEKEKREREREREFRFSIYVRSVHTSTSTYRGLINFWLHLSRATANYPADPTNSKKRHFDGVSNSNAIM